MFWSLFVLLLSTVALGETRGVFVFSLSLLFPPFYIQMQSMVSFSTDFENLAHGSGVAFAFLVCVCV